MALSLVWFKRDLRVHDHAALAAAAAQGPVLCLYVVEPCVWQQPDAAAQHLHFVRESLFDLVDRGTTILVSTHYMDEAERCHRLAILAEGRLVAEGPPRQLMHDIPAAAVEIEAEDVRAARGALDGDPQVLSVAQLGTRLHALLERDTPDAAGHVSGRLRRAGVTAAVHAVDASLEDVFVASTGFRRNASLPTASAPAARLAWV